MDSSDITIYLSRILSGYYTFVYNNQKYKLVYPDVHVKYEAELYAQDVYDNNKFNDWITEEEILDFLISSGLWSYDGDNQLKKISDDIENTKVDLYNTLLNPNKTKFVRRQLNNYTNLYNKRYEIRHTFDHLTISGYANYLKSQYILLYSLYDHNNKLVFNIDDVIDYKTINDISNLIMSNAIDVKTFRKIARSDSWRSYWTANKNNVFDKATINWSDEQKTLVVLTKMYDSAYEHPECPPDNVIEDDDMFDGWMILQRRENEKSKNKARSEKILKDKKLGNAQEVFLVANSREEASNIYNLNDVGSRNIIKERESAIKNQGTLKESELPDVQRQINMDLNKKIMEAARNRR
jgi:hypothetical protein